MSILYGFTAGGEGPDAFSDFYGTDGRCRSLCQLFLCFIRYIGAAVEFCFAGSQVHGKGKAGGDAAFLTVGFRQEFKNLNTG